MENNQQQAMVNIRPMTLNDLHRVHEIDLLSFTMPWSERSFRFELAENANSTVLVAEVSRNGDRPGVIGMIVVWVILDEAHVATIATHPDFRGNGVGRRLLAHGLLSARKRGARVAYLEVRSSNLTAKTLYEKFGFRVVGVRARYYKDNNEDALLMTLDELQADDLEQLSV